MIPSGKLTVCYIENGPVEIVDLPSYKMVIFYSYVKLPEGRWLHQKMGVQIITSNMLATWDSW